MVLRDLYYRLKGRAPLYHLLKLPPPKKLEKKFRKLEKDVIYTQRTYGEILSPGARAKAMVVPEDVQRLRDRELAMNTLRDLLDLMKLEVGKEYWDAAKELSNHESVKELKRYIKYIAKTPDALDNERIRSKVFELSSKILELLIGRERGRETG